MIDGDLKALVHTHTTVSTHSNVHAYIFTISIYYTERILYVRIVKVQFDMAIMLVITMIMITTCFLYIFLHLKW